MTDEDCAEDTIALRLELLKADRSRVHDLLDVYSAEQAHGLSLKLDLDYVVAYVRRHPAIRLIVLDPLQAFMGGVDCHRNDQVRSVLEPLRKVAERHRVAIVGINHLNKGEGSNALHRNSGSIAFVAAARSSWLVASEKRAIPGRKGS